MPSGLLNRELVRRRSSQKEGRRENLCHMRAFWRSVGKTGTSLEKVDGTLLRCKRESHAGSMQRKARARRGRASADFASARPITAGWSDGSDYGGAGANEIGTDAEDEAYSIADVEGRTPWAIP